MTSIPGKVLDAAMLNLLREISPNEATIHLFTKYIKKAYEQRVSNLKTTKNKADQEIQRLTDKRKF